MKHRRVRLLENLGAGRTVKIAAVIYLVISSLVLISVLVTFISAEKIAGDNPGVSALETATWLIPAAWVTHLIGIVVILVLLRRCDGCQEGLARHITTAMEKMSKGDLGWKITLRRGDELAEIADSVTRASESLAERIGRLKTQTRQLTEVENYLIDSVEADRVGNPNTLKALRRLKICTHRLCSNVEDFQISATPAIPQGMPQKPVESIDRFQQA
jgi:methyl-accepting chemotaxis protein